MQDLYRSARNWIENHAKRVELSKVTEGAVMKP